MVTVEATAVRDTGRISPGDLGIYNEKQVEAFRPITQFIREHGAIAGIQLAHAGRKASMGAPWQGGKRVEISDGGWIPEAPSAIPFAPHYHTPKELSIAEIDDIVDDFVNAAKRALEAGFQVIEIHMAHGYLLNEFLSPLSNHRKDEYGGPIENRMRLPLSVAKAVREVWPTELPILVRISATDWAPEEGWDLDQSLVLTRALIKAGIDMIDCSSGGTLEHPVIPLGPGYQVPFAERIRKDTGIPTSAVGLIVNAAQAEAILREGKADVVSMAREFLRDPYFPLHAAKELGVDVPWPAQYLRAK